MWAALPSSGRLCTPVVGRCNGKYQSQGWIRVCARAQGCFALAKNLRHCCLRRTASFQFRLIRRKGWRSSHLCRPGPSIGTQFCASGCRMLLLLHRSISPSPSVLQCRTSVPPTKCANVNVDNSEAFANNVAKASANGSYAATRKRSSR